MSIWCILPVKPMKRAKSRLASVLTAEARSQLSEDLLRRTLATVGAVDEIERALVVSRDSEALAIARELGAYTVTESGSPDLNPALERATRAAAAFKARAVLILPTDLPLLTPEDLRTMLATLERTPTPAIVIVSDEQENGTNALLVSPPGVLTYAYGNGSFGAHLTQAGGSGLSVRKLFLPNVRFDLDTPADWARYRRLRALRDLTPAPTLRRDPNPAGYTLPGHA